MGLRGASSKTMASTAAPTGVTPTGSPYVYQNTTTGPQTVMVSGGTVSLIEYSRDGTTYFPAGLIAGSVTLNPNDRIRLTYLVAPTVTAIQLS